MPRESYVAMSRATRLSQIGFIGALTLSRITDKISGKPFLKVQLAEEERLDQLELVTRSRLQDKDSLAGVQEEGEDSEEEQAVENPFGNDEDEGCEEEPAVNLSYGPSCHHPIRQAFLDHSWQLSYHHRITK